MDELDIPIFKKAYELYKTLHECRASIAKQDRHTLWQRSENITISIVEDILRAGHGSRDKKLPILEETSIQLSLLRVHIRMTKDVKAIDDKKYVAIQGQIDEIGRMLGGWIKSMKDK